MPRFLPLLLLLAVLLPGSGVADDELSDTDHADLARVEAYLNSLTTMRSRFIQVTSTGGYNEGDVVLDRPDRVRFEYDPPHPALIVADGLSLLYYDKELQEATYLPLWETPLWFLIGSEIELDESLQVVDVARGPGSLRVRLTQSDSPEQGTVELQFSDQPLQLRRWEVVDPQGIITEVALLQPRFGVEVTNDDFDVSDLPGVGLKPGGDR